MQQLRFGASKRRIKRERITENRREAAEVAKLDPTAAMQHQADLEQAGGSLEVSTHAQEILKTSPKSPLKRMRPGKSGKMAPSHNFAFIPDLLKF